MLTFSTIENIQKIFTFNCNYIEAFCSFSPFLLLYRFILLFLLHVMELSQRLDEKLEKQESAKKTFRLKLQGAKNTILQHEDLSYQQTALDTIDFGLVLAEGRKWKEKELEQGHEAPEDCMLLAGLLAWFKHNFFSWCNKPLCQNKDCTPTVKCQVDDMTSSGMVEPTQDERADGASRVETYTCRHCKTVTRFARFNSPCALLRTKTGRCGEWANCFGLICRAVGFDTRYVLDFTDHVWCEVWLPSKGRYCHCDPCENSLDAPLTYECGWGKQLTYILSISIHGVVDASAKYTQQLSHIVERREALGYGAPEVWIQEEIAATDRDMYAQWLSVQTSHAPPDRLRGSSETEPIDHISMSYSAAMTAVAQGKEAVAAWALKNRHIDIKAIEMRRSALQQELIALSQDANYGIKNVAETIGRTSGDITWIQQRQELGNK